MQSTRLGRRNALVLTFLLAVALPAIAAASPITLMWDPSVSTLTGYKVYVGTTSGSTLSSATSVQVIDVGNATTYTWPDAVDGTRYFFSVTAYLTNGSGTVEGQHSAEISGYSNAPTTLSNPGNRTSTINVAIAALQLSGSDPDGPVTYTASNLPPGLSLTASTGLITGTPTAAGSYTVTVGASEVGYGNPALAASQTFTWTIAAPDTTLPTVLIVSPAPPSYTTSTNSVTLSGTASDNVGVTQVTWSNSAGGSGTASGTASWNTGAISLASGLNTITITARDAANNTATATLAVTFTSSLPSGWTGVDIGPSINGSSSGTGSSFSVSARGADIWNAADEMRFVYKSMSGDFDISGRVASLSPTNPWSKAGFMIRDSANANAVNVAMMVSVSNGVIFQNRNATGGASVSTKVLGQAAPIYLKIERRGSTFNGYYSANGTTWTLVGTYTVTMVANPLAGMALTSHDTAATATAAFDSVSTTAPETVPPTVGITSPTSGSSYSTNVSTVTLSGTASDNVGVTQVTWANNRGGSGTASGTTNWSTSAITLQVGSNVITVTARDAAGNTATATLTVSYALPTISAVSAAPSSGTGASQSFALQYSDSLSATDLATVWVRFATTLTGPANTCQAYYDRPGATLYLLNDAGTAWLPASLGASGTLQNSQCAVALGGSSVVLSGTTLTLNLAMTFKAAYAATHNIYITAVNSTGINSGWQTRGTWTVPATAAPSTSVTADAVTPSSGSGASQAFALQYSSPAGVSNIASVWVGFATSLSGAAGACQFYYDRPASTLYLLNDAGTTWVPATLGTSGALQNSQCGVALASSSVSTSGNTLTLNLATTFTGAYAGTQNIYMIAVNAAGANSGWQTRGTWTVPAGASPPPPPPPTSVSADSATPSSGSGATQTFAFRYSDPLGASDLSTVWVRFATSLSGAANTCQLYYDRSATLFLLNDAGTAWVPASLGTSGSLQNSQCGVALASSSVSLSGNTLTLNLAMSFSAAYAGTKNSYIIAVDGAGRNSGWQTAGTWTVPVGTMPTVGVTADSATPSSGTGTGATFAFQYSDSAGAANLATVWVRIASSLSGPANTCQLYYDRQAAQLYLLNDAGTAWIPAALGTSGTLQNSQCAVALASSSASMSGNSLTLNLAMTFTPAYSGTWNIYMIAVNAAGTNSGWQTRGTWTR